MSVSEDKRNMMEKKKEKAGEEGDLNSPRFCETWGARI